ncbi:MAG: hypothetical protein NVS9B14_15050 [Candidatus Acidiferrum sp.]
MTAARIARSIAIASLCAVYCAGLFAGYLTNYSYATQFREMPNAGPSALHLLGTDGLGRDLFTRIIYGTRVSLLLAPAAALISTAIATLLGCVAGFAGGWREKTILAAGDLSLSLPLLLVLLALRAVLPLNISPIISTIATFVLLGVLGWSASLRVVWGAARNLRDSDFVLLARASGCSRWRLLTRHIVPNLRPVMLAQFWISIPLFVLTEATLSMLGLGVMEPMASWGNLLKGLEDFSAVRANPWSLAPLILLIGVVISFQLVLPQREEIA